MTTRDQIFHFIENYKVAHDGLPPTHNEIADACFLHESTVRYHLIELARRGKMATRENSKRGLILIGGSYVPPSVNPMQVLYEALDQHTTLQRYDKLMVAEKVFEALFPGRPLVPVQLPLMEERR